MRELLLRGKVALLNFVLIFLLVFAWRADAQVVVAQISDTHLGEPQAPHAFDNLRRAVDMVNARHPDAVIVSGDIGENYDQWLIARGILKWLKAPVYYAPGNHDVHTNDVAKYREVFGPDYYRFQIKGVTFVVIDSQLLGNYDNFEAQSPQPLPASTLNEGNRMLAWLGEQPGSRTADNRRRWWNFGRREPQRFQDADDDDRRGGIVIGIQHIPAARGDNMPPDPKPYWTISEPYRSREIAALHRLGIRHMLAGHWHVGTVFERDGITWHIAPTRSEERRVGKECR